MDPEYFELLNKAPALRIAVLGSVIARRSCPKTRLVL